MLQWGHTNIPIRAAQAQADNSWRPFCVVCEEGDRLWPASAVLQQQGVCVCCVFGTCASQHRVVPRGKLLVHQINLLACWVYVTSDCMFGV